MVVSPRQSSCPPKDTRNHPEGWAPNAGHQGHLQLEAEPLGMLLQPCTEPDTAHSHPGTGQGVRAPRREEEPQGKCDL